MCNKKRNQATMSKYQHPNYICIRFIFIRCRAYNSVYTVCTAAKHSYCKDRTSI